MSASSPESVVLAECDDAFEAQAIVAALQAAGIEATALEPHHAVPVEARRARVPVCVSSADCEQARTVLEASGAVVDWDATDVGQRIDDLPLTRPGRMPWAARVAFAVAILVALLGLSGAIAMLVVSLRAS